MRSPRLLVSLALSLGLFVVIQGAFSAGLLTAYWETIFTYACVFVTYALGLNVIYGYNGQFSLGHAAFYGIGAYTAALLTKLVLGVDLLAFPVALFAGGTVAAVIGLLIGLPILRLRSDYLGIATLGFGIMVKVLFDNSEAVLPAMAGARGLTGIAKATSFGWAFFIMVGAIIIVRNLIYSSHGRAIISVREDEIAADTMGINTTTYKMIAFTTGCFLAGVAGGLYAHLYAFLHPSSFDFLKSIDVLMVVVLGGLGSITGTILAAVGWIFLLEGLRIALPQELLEWRMIIYPLVMIIVMLVRPQGLMGGIEVGPLRAPRVLTRLKSALSPSGGELSGEEASVGPDR